MHLSDHGLMLIQAWEGIEDGDPTTVLLEPYIDNAGVYTVGWGHALTTASGQLIDRDVFGHTPAAKLAQDAMTRMFGAPSISKERASELLNADVAHFAQGVTTRLTDECFQNQFDALVALAFNIGLGNFDQSTVKRLHLAGDRVIGDVSLHALCAASKAKTNPTTMAGAFTRWAYSNGKWTLGLFRRRVCEMMIYGGHPYDVSINTGKAFKV
jgi:GH24 family phage-related lysozyme (muramidase)